MGSTGQQYELVIDRLRPYFAELPYYLWGPVNYDSEGDCERPTDREWTWIDLRNRESQESVSIERREGTWCVSGDGPAAARAALFLCDRCGAGEASDAIRQGVGDWDLAAGMARAERVASEFASPKLAMFDSHLFWGSWKWIGWFATEFTWVGRWIMYAVLTDDRRGVYLCVDWLRHGTCCEEQSQALRVALAALTGESFDSDNGWLRWYDGSVFRRGAKGDYPEPDLDAWRNEMKTIYAI